MRSAYRERKTKLQQWWHETVTPLDNDRFLLVHYIKGEMVKLIIKKREDEVVTVVDENYDECYMMEAKPYLLYEVEELCPETLGMDKPLLMISENNNIIRKDVKID